MATHIEYTPSSSPTGIQQTISFWIKRSELGTDQCVFEARQNNTNMSTIKFNTNDELQIYSENGGTTNVYLKTSRKFRDPNGWYHIVYAIDTSQGTAADRIKMYVNGVQETAFSSSTYPSQNYDNFWYGIAQKQVIGRDNQGGGSEDFQGILSHFHYSRGYVYQASTFGSTDSTTGEWKINTSPSVNYGATGWFILKDGNSVTDQSGNGNNFTVGSGTLTKTEDNPSNVFCTLNPLGLKNDVTFTSGNTNATYGTSGTRSIVIGTLGANSGKYYWEIEIQGSSDANNGVLGVSMDDHETGYAVAGETNQSWGFKGYDGAVQNNNSSVGGTWATFTNGDIIGVAINLDDEQGGLNKLYFSKNGTWLNGANPSNHSATTGVVGITKPENGVTGFYFPVVSDAGSSATPKFKCNFGNGYFGTVAVSSAGTNASNNGIFEYDVPTGYTALSTKGLNL